MFKEKDFYLPNISNIPNTQERIVNLVQIFDKRDFTLSEINSFDMYEQMGYKKETFRKLLNHSTILGILQAEDQVYKLSSISKKLINGHLSFEEYVKKLINNNQEVYNVCIILSILSRVFHQELNTKTVYYIFSLIGRDRTDLSAIESVGRNIRSIFSLLKLGGMLDKNRSKISFLNYELLDEKYYNVLSLKEVYGAGVININLINQYLCQFFSKNVTKKILSCVSTYELDNYIWNRSSLYKNQGEVRNLNGEYIMTVTIK